MVYVVYGLPRPPAVAGHGRHGGGGLAGRLALAAQARGRLLVLPCKQRLWVAWGIHDHAWALVGLQFCLATLNIRGVYKNE
jgi:hypothetical protein